MTLHVFETRNAPELDRVFPALARSGTQAVILAQDPLFSAERKRVAELALRYRLPTLSGERKSCFAITEPGAGSDAKAIRTSARREGDEWVINGEKTFITGGNEADFAMVFAVTDKDGRQAIGNLPTDEVGAGWREGSGADDRRADQ